MSIDKLTAADIKKMSYNELIGLVRETNRPPGGVRSISSIARQTFLDPTKKVLEIGTSTGITAIELARLTKASITAIDINPMSLNEAAERAARYGVQDCTQFRQEDATRLSFSNASFDVVFCGNVTSLISNKEQALQEYTRVLKVGGYVAAIPMYYVKPPSEDLIRRVSEAIQVKIKPLDRKFWLDFFNVQPLVQFTVEDYTFDNIPAPEVDAFVDEILARPHLQALKADATDALRSTYRRFMHLFQENLSHMGYSLVLLRKEPEPMDRELFTSTPVFSRAG